MAGHVRLSGYFQFRTTGTHNEPAVAKMNFQRGCCEFLSIPHLDFNMLFRAPLFVHASHAPFHTLSGLGFKGFICTYFLQQGAGLEY